MVSFGLCQVTRKFDNLSLFSVISNFINQKSSSSSFILLSRYPVHYSFCTVLLQSYISSSNMSGRGRKLPSWMMKCTATEQASSSERKEETNENGFVEPHSKAVEPQKKVEADETGVPLIENTCNVLKKCEAKTRKRKSNKLDEGQSERVQEDESCFIKPCKGTRSKSKPAEDQVDDFLESHIEKKSDGIVRKRVRHNAPRKKHTQSSTKKFHNVTAESSPSEDDLTVEDLVSIAEEVGFFEMFI